MTYFIQADATGWTMYRGVSKAHFRTLRAAKMVCDELGVKVVILSRTGEKLN
jgi:hypothetical protein